MYYVRANWLFLFLLRREGCLVEQLEERIKIEQGNLVKIYEENNSFLAPEVQSKSQQLDKLITSYLKSKMSSFNKNKTLLKVADLLLNAENILDELIEEMVNLEEENEKYIEISELIFYARITILNLIRFPKIEELTIEQIIEAINHRMKDIDNNIELNEMKRLIKEVENGRIEDYRYIIELEVKNWYLDMIRERNE